VKCGRCSFTCNSNSQLEMHSRTCDGIRKRKPGRFNCMYCNMTTEKKNILIWHLAHHEGVHEVCYLKCNGCEFATMLADEMTAHENEHHGGSKALSVTGSDKVTYLQDILKCPVCSVGLPWKSIYVKHFRQDHKLNRLADYLEEKYPESPYPRTIRFPKHLLGENPIVAAALNSAVPRSDNVRVEICRFHCESCEFSTSDKQAFADHQKSHATTIDRSINMNYHPHVKETVSSKYSCTSCAFTSAVENQYRLHIADHMKYDDIDNGFKCGACAFKCPSRSRVQEHINKFHSDHFECEIVKISNKAKKSASGRNKKVAPGNNNKNNDVKSAKEKQVDVDVFSTGDSINSVKSTALQSSRKPASSASQTPTNMNILDKFERELPSVQIFPRDIKCPLCDFANRFRVNVTRHLKLHREQGKHSPHLTGLQADSRLSFNLWKPQDNEGYVNSEGAPDSGELEGLDENLTEGRVVKASGKSDAEYANPRLRQELVKPVTPRGANEADSADRFQHARTNDIQYFTCEVCEDRFNTEANLERHITVRHEGPYVCHLCGQLLWQRSSVRKHYMAEHAGAPVMFEVIRRGIENDNEEHLDGGEKKVARIQGKTFNHMLA
jgi:hypothetical protein